MNVIKVSPLGAYFIACLVTYWNISKNATKKAEIRNDLRSENAFRVCGAVLKILQLVDERKVEHVDMQYRGLETIEQISYFMQTLSTAPYVEGETDMRYQREIQEKKGLLYRDVATYFAAMFKAGHFETLPMPILGYDLDPDDPLESGK